MGIGLAPVLRDGQSQAQIREDNREVLEIIMLEWVPSDYALLLLLLLPTEASIGPRSAYLCRFEHVLVKVG